MKLTAKQVKRVFQSYLEDENKKRIHWRDAVEFSPVLRALFTVSCGLKPFLALKALEENRWCLLCKDTLCRNRVCFKCLETPEGQRAAKEDHAKRTGSAQQLFSAEKRKEIHQKKIKTVTKNYGVDSPLRNKKILKKSQDTLMRNHGVRVPLKSKRLVDKMLRTQAVRYQNGHSARDPSVQAIYVQRCNAKHGTDYFFQSEDFRKKFTETNLARRGVAHQSQDPEVRAKQVRSHFLTKTVTIKGVEYKCQGYEPTVLKWIEQYGFCKLTTSAEVLPRIRYTDENGKVRFYFPDIGFRSKRTGLDHLVEVKSLYTLGLRNVLEKALAAWKLARKKGFRYHLAVVEDDVIQWFHNPRSLKNYLNPSL